MSGLVAETGWAKNVIESQLVRALRTGVVVRAGERFLDAPALEMLKSHVVKAVDDFHKKNPLVGGIGREELRDASGRDAGSV